MKHRFFYSFFSILLVVCMATNSFAYSLMADEVSLADLPATSVKKVDTVKQKLYLSDGTIIKYSERIWVKATAYCHCYRCCGKHPWDKGYGLTASGIDLLDGNEHRVVAAPKGWEFGTELYLVGADGSADYGYASVEDRGGAIKGSRLDVYYPSHQACIDYGVHKNLYAYIIEWVDYSHTFVS